MDLLFVAQSSFWQRCFDAFTTPSLQLFLLLGSGVLAIALLILTLTRWGHVRPITKCVILSVIAHILLLGYAYGTRLISQFPVAETESEVNVQWVDDAPEKDPQSEAEQSTVAENEISANLDQFVADHQAPEMESLARPQPGRPFEMERIWEPENEDTNLDTEQSAVQPRLADLDRTTPDFQVRSAEPQFDDVPPIDVQANVPEPIEFQRHGERPEDITDFQPQSEVDQNPIQPSSEIETLNIEPSILQQAAETEASESDSTFQSDLVVPDANASISKSFATAGATANQQPDGGADDSQVTNPAPSTRTAPPPQRRLGDGAETPAIYRYRSPSGRTAIATANGGSVDTEQAVAASLKWLAEKQSGDGRWDPKLTGAGQERQVYGHDRGGCGTDADAGITALATLAFLGAGHTHLEGEYSSNVRKALEFLIRYQAIDGDLSGGARLYARMYCHSMALLALSEAHALTGDVRLKRPVQLGVWYSVEAQNKADGGWRYQPGDAGDMSQFGWQVMALKNAQLGGIDVSPVTFNRMTSFLHRCRAGKQGGLACYRPGQGPSTTMTAEALVCKSFLNQPVSAASLKEAQDRILAEPPSLTRVNLYYWYYATIAMQRHGGEAWTQWNHDLTRVLLSQQETVGRDIGSWAPNGVWAGYGGRVYSTALATLCLEVYYRYAPPTTSTAQQAQDPREIRPFTR